MTDENTEAASESENGRVESVFEDVGRAFDSRREFLKKGAAATAMGAGLSSGTGVAGASEGRQNSQRFVDALNFALTLERLEATFYVRGLNTFSERDLVESDIGRKAGERTRSTMYERFETIRNHEQGHVRKIATTIESLGGDPIGEDDVEFQFDLSSPETFITTAQALETTGVSAYTGAIDLLSGSDELLTAAATIATVEGRHSAYLNDLTGESPFPLAFDRPRAPDKIREAIQPFLVSDH